MNVSKLVRSNLAKPMSTRVSLSDVQASVSVARMRGDCLALLVECNASPAMVAFRTREAMIERIGSVGGADIGNKAYC